MFKRERRKVKEIFFRARAHLPLLGPAVWTIKTSNGSSFKIATPFDSAIGATLFIAGEEAFEPETVTLFKELITEVNTFVDIGANIGIYTFIAKCYNPKAKVIAFEPEEHAYSLLLNSLALNNWRDVIAEKIALADFEGETVLYIPNGDSNASTNPDFRKNTLQQNCITNKLDTYCMRNGINKVELLKIDTESTEPNVLCGAREIIGDCKPDIICEVLRGRTEKELFKILKPFGYRFYHLTANGPIMKPQIEGDEAYRYLNYLFTAKTDI